MFGLDYAAAATVCGEHAEPTPHTVLLKNEGWSTGTKEQDGGRLRRHDLALRQGRRLAPAKQLLGRPLFAMLTLAGLWNIQPSSGTRQSQQDSLLLEVYRWLLHRQRTSTNLTPPPGSAIQMSLLAKDICIIVNSRVRGSFAQTNPGTYSLVQRTQRNSDLKHDWRRDVYGSIF
jgi:hypothetical protein